MGPGAGDEGGRMVAFGAPAEVARTPGSRTAPFLARFMDSAFDAPRAMSAAGEEVRA
jgi:excinuclease ABC subunit A